MAYVDQLMSRASYASVINGSNRNFKVIRPNRSRRNKYIRRKSKKFRWNLRNSQIVTGSIFVNNNPVSFQVQFWTNCDVRNSFYCIGQIVKSILILFDIFNIFHVIYKIKIYCSFEVTLHTVSIWVYIKIEYFDSVAVHDIINTCEHNCSKITTNNRI